MLFTVLDWQGYFDHYECALNKNGTDTQFRCLKATKATNETNLIKDKNNK